jgi:hypothetical protein
VYPRAGSRELLEIEVFNSWDTSLWAMLDHMIIGRRFTIDFSHISELETWQCIGIFVYLFIYLIALMLVLQLMYRFLNATLTTQYNSIQKESKLQWRVNFARQVLRSEFMWERFWDTSVGDANGNFQFQHVSAQLTPHDNDWSEEVLDYNKRLEPKVLASRAGRAAGTGGAGGAGGTRPQRSELGAARDKAAAKMQAVHRGRVSRTS